MWALMEKSPPGYLPGDKMGTWGLPVAFHPSRV